MGWETALDRLLLQQIHHAEKDAAKASAVQRQLLDYGEYSNEADADLAVRLTREAKIASIPLSVFYADDPGHRMLRFCFAKDDATLGAGAEILLGL